jgi:hypothetical protein
MMRVSSVKLSIDEDGVIGKIRKGNCLIDLSQVQHVESNSEGIEIVMRSGDRFFVENLTFDEIVGLLRSI